MKMEPIMHHKEQKIVQVTKSSILSFIATSFIICLSSAARGDVVMFIAMAWKFTSTINNKTFSLDVNTEHYINDFKNATFYIVISAIVSFSVFFALGGVLKW